MKYVLGFFGAIGLVVVGLLVYIYLQVRFDAYKIIDYRPAVSSQIYDKNGKLIANIFDKNYRIYARFDEIPSRIIEALIAVEDTTFFEHKGVNIEAIFRALAKDIKAMKLVEGASTITQQLIKNMVLTRDKTILRKLKEVVLSFKIESALTKDQILERYLNQVYFGHGYYGIKTAALGYFHKSLNALSLKEISMLVGLPRAPSSYDPTRHLDLSLSRGNRVLSRMHSLGWITDEQYSNGLNETPLVYDETLTQNKAPYVVDQVIKEASRQFDDIKTGGYKIYLGLDLRVQNAAKEALKKGYDDIIKRDIEDENSSMYMDENDTQQNGAIVVMENKTGNVLALVGGVDYQKSAYNRAVQSKRQPGSSIKPFIYQIAIDQGYSPMSKIADISRVYKNTTTDENWTPKNYGNSFGGLITLKNALTKSRNLATLNLVTTVGLDEIHQGLSEIGFKGVPLDLSISLGSFGVSPLEYAKYYSVFPNVGEMVTPRVITRIEDMFGNNFTYDIEKKQFSTPEQVYLTLDMMRNVVRHGTGRRARVKGIELAGKTGTTNENIDAWFCGYSPDIEVLVWYGRDNNSPMGKHETGGVAAAPVFKNFMQKFLSIYPQTTRKFSIPDGVHSRVINGHDEYFTDRSPLPKETSKSNTQSASELIF